MESMTRGDEAAPEQKTSLPMLSRKNASKHLTDNGTPISASYLAVLAVKGEGPSYQLFGRHALYEVDELNRWAKARLRPPRAAGHQAA